MLLSRPVAAGIRLSTIVYFYRFLLFLYDFSDFSCLISPKLAGLLRSPTRPSTLLGTACGSVFDVFLIFSRFLRNITEIRSNLLDDTARCRSRPASGSSVESTAISADFLLFGTFRRLLSDYGRHKSLYADSRHSVPSGNASGPAGRSVRNRGCTRDRASGYRALS